MIPFLLFAVVAPAGAEPYRFTGTATAGADLDGGPSVRGTLDYGLIPHLAIVTEAGTTPGDRPVSGGLGVRVDPVDGRWWRVGVVALPEVILPAGTLDRGSDLDLGLRVGVRPSYLVVWGMHLDARWDLVTSLDHPSPSWEGGLGLGVRL